MKVLAIETAFEACSVALFDGHELIANRHVPLGRGHAEALVPMIAGLPDKGRADGVLVGLGPGSFTGVRIGLAAARALGLAWGAKVTGYPTLALVVAMARSAAGPQALTVCMNGGHGQWFVQNFDAAGFPEADPASLAPDQARALARHRLIVGNRAGDLAALVSDRAVEAIDLAPDAVAAASLDARLLRSDLSLIYGRGPDATPLVRQKGA